MTEEDANQSAEFGDEPDFDPSPKRLSLFWKLAIGLAVVVAAAAAAGIGAAIVRITCESDCTVPYLGGIGLGLIFGGFGTLVLAVLVARSMQEWTEYHERERREANTGDGYPD